MQQERRIAAVLASGNTCCPQGWACVHVQSNFSTRRVLTVARRGNRLMFSHRKQPTHQIFPSLFLLFPLLASEVFLFLSFIRCSWNVIQYFCEDLVMKTKNGLFGSLFAMSVTSSLSRSFSLSQATFPPIRLSPGLIPRRLVSVSENRYCTILQLPNHIMPSAG